MAETVNLAEAARRLGVSDKTTRKRLARSYAGEDRIRGAVRNGRDWAIPVAEIDRLLERSIVRLDDATYAWVVATDSMVGFSAAARKRLEAAARAFLAASRARKPAQRDYVGELRDALRQYDELQPMAKLVDAIHRRGKFGGGKR